MALRHAERFGRDSSSRLSLALLLAALAHAVVILGLSFSPPDRPPERKALEVTLARTPPRPAPQQADYYAPENQEGGGQSDAKAEPASRLSPEDTGGQPLEEESSEADESSSQPHPLLTHPKDSPHKAAAPNKEAKPAAIQKHRPVAPPKKIDLTAVEQQISEFSNEFVQAQEKYAKQSKILYVNSVSAHKYAAAAYEKAWQDKIERIGNLNYPDEARRNRLSGSLLLSVGIRKDGSLHSVKVRQSSGQAVLDDAAKRIVTLASPFAPFPPGLSEEADVLVITRTWKFFSDSHLSTAP